MALFHLSVTQTKRSAGQSAIASAAYRAGERLYSEYYGEYSDYTRKGGVICSDILLPSHAPPEYADRQTLWNAVEKAERGKNAQLAYSFDIALQNEFSLEENIALARQFLLENFVSRGMVVDFAVHQPDREDGGIPNPHFHVLCPIRPIEQNGKWGLKQRRVYELDEDGNRIRDANGKFVFNAVPTTDWGSPETLEHWRQTWAELCNAKFAEKGIDVRIIPILTLAPGLRVLHNGQPVFKTQPVREPTEGKAGAPKISEFPGAVKSGGVVINVTMDVLLVGMCGNDKSVPPLRPAHSQLIADTVCLLRGNLARIEGLSYLIAQHIIFFLLFPARHCGIAGLCQKELVRHGGRITFISGDILSAFCFLRVLAIVQTIPDGLGNRFAFTRMAL